MTAARQPFPLVFCGTKEVGPKLEGSLMSTFPPFLIYKGVYVAQELLLLFFIKKIFFVFALGVTLLSFQFLSFNP